MDRTMRTLLLVAFTLNLAFLVVALLDYYLWDEAGLVPIIIAWAVVLFTFLLLLLFMRPGQTQIIERVVESRATPARAVQSFTAIEAPKPAKAAPGGPFTYNGYTLYSRSVTLKGGGARDIYFFAKKTPKSGHPIAKPDGYHVGVNERTGLPFLKKGAGKDGEDLTPATPEPGPEPQCGALTADGKQCRNSARHGSKYCVSHKGYQPVSEATLMARTDTISKLAAKDTVPSHVGVAGDATGAAGEQCAALTAVGLQCKFASRDGSKYCAKHKGYRPPTAKAIIGFTDTKPRSRKAADTLPTVRKARKK